MVGGEGLADRRVGRRVGHGQRRLQHVPRLAGVYLPERVLAFGPALAARLAAVVEQLADPGGHPAVLDHPVRVVVHHGDQRVRLFPGVAEHADDLVGVAEVVGVDVALGRGHRAQVLGPAGARHAGLDQLQGRALGLGRLPGRAEAGDAGQQGQRRRAALRARIVDQSLADELLHGGGAPAAAALPPPGAEEFTDHEFGVEGAADGQQLARRAQEFGEESVRRQRSSAWPLAASGSAGGAPGGLASSALRAHPDSLSDLDMRTLCYVVMPAVIPPHGPHAPRRRASGRPDVQS